MMPTLYEVTEGEAGHGRTGLIGRPRISIREILGVVVLWLLTALLGSAAYDEWITWQRFDVVGISTRGTILQIDQTGKGGQGVQYEYRVGGGEIDTVRTWEHVNSAVLEHLNAGEVVEILYDPSNPEFSRIAENNTTPWLYLMAIPLACVTIGSTIVLVVFSVRKLTASTGSVAHHAI